MEPGYAAEHSNPTITRFQVQFLTMTGQITANGPYKAWVEMKQKYIEDATAWEPIFSLATLYVLHIILGLDFDKICPLLTKLGGHVVKRVPESPFRNEFLAWLRTFNSRCGECIARIQGVGADFKVKRELLARLVGEFKKDLHVNEIEDLKKKFGLGEADDPRLANAPLPLRLPHSAPHPEFASTKSSLSGRGRSTSVSYGGKEGDDDEEGDDDNEDELSEEELAFLKKAEARHKPIPDKILDEVKGLVEAIVESAQATYLSRVKHMTYAAAKEAKAWLTQFYHYLPGILSVAIGLGQEKTSDDLKETSEDWPQIGHFIGQISDLSGKLASFGFRASQLEALIKQEIAKLDTDLPLPEKPHRPSVNNPPEGRPEAEVWLPTIPKSGLDPQRFLIYANAKAEKLLAGTPQEAMAKEEFLNFCKVVVTTYCGNYDPLKVIQPFEKNDAFQKERKDFENMVTVYPFLARWTRVWGTGQAEAAKKVEMTQEKLVAAYTERNTLLSKEEEELTKEKADVEEQISQTQAAIRAAPLEKLAKGGYTRVENALEGYSQVERSLRAPIERKTAILTALREGTLPDVGEEGLSYLNPDLDAARQRVTAAEGDLDKIRAEIEALKERGEDVRGKMADYNDLNDVLENASRHLAEEEKKEESFKSWLSSLVDDLNSFGSTIEHLERQKLREEIPHFFASSIDHLAETLPKDAYSYRMDREMVRNLVRNYSVGLNDIINSEVFVYIERRLIKMIQEYCHNG